MKMIFSTMVGACPLFDVRPRDPGGRVLRVLFLPAAEFVALPVGDRRGVILPGQAVPEVLDELKTFGPPQLEDRREFGVHGVKIWGFLEWFKAGL